MVFCRLHGIMPKKRVLILIVAYNSERTIRQVLERMPGALLEYDTEILVVDDASGDRTFQRAREFDQSPFPVTVLYNPVSQGYGGNQKIGFHYAIHEQFDFVVLLHGSGQYAPEVLPDLLKPLASCETDAVLGSRMMHGMDALKHGMPLYKYFANRMLTRLQNRILRRSLSEYHCGYRLYSVNALKRIPFQLNSQGFLFDTEIAIQLFRAGLRILEMPVPTYSSDEIRRVSGFQYAWGVLKVTVLSRVQDMGLMYERKFDVADPAETPQYQPKFSFESPHSLALDRIPVGASVVDVGCASGYMARELKRKNCRVTGIDQYPVSPAVPVDRFIQHNLNESNFPVDTSEFDYVLLLDVVEHLHSPENFVDALRAASLQATETRIIFSTGNIAYFITRVMLLLGFFRYGPRGILDLTHTRLFTFASSRALFAQAGYQIEEVIGVPAPFPLALGHNGLSRFLVRLNHWLINLSKPIFSYQIFMVVRPLPSLEWLLARASESSRQKALSRS